MLNAVFFILFMHVGVGAFYNKYRIRQLLKYISLSRGRELTEAEFLVLLRTYTSFWAPYRFSPSRTRYPALYTNEDFVAFARQSKYMMMYVYAVAIPCVVWTWSLT